MGKRQDFIDLYKSGQGTRQKYIDLSGNYFRRKSMQGVHDPFKPLTILDMLKSGAFARDLKHGGIASLAPRRGRVVNPGGYAGELEIPEGFLEGLPNEDYQKIIEEFLKQKKKDELMRNSAPTQWVAQGGLAGILNL